MCATKPDFDGIPVYNPLSLAKIGAIAQFQARNPPLESLLDLLRQERPPHVLIIGSPGMGKTTLLQRVGYGVEDDPELNGRYLALSFPDQQYNLSRLHHFWLNTLNSLAELMERLDNRPMLEKVTKCVEAVGDGTPQEIENRVPQFLAEITRQTGKGLLLLVDHADRLFETLDEAQQRQLRELLSSRPDLTLFGAATRASDGISKPDRAFFEFFRIQHLAPLTFSEVHDLLLHLGESIERREGIAEWLEADAARLRTIVQLTGGNPRTTVLLFHLILEGLAGGTRECLAQLLDRVTPIYQERVDELPAQAQQVFDAVAVRWDPVTALEAANETGLETTAVSTQLTRLVKQGLLEKADPGDSRKSLYQVADRFFNLWYLMRAGRRVRAKLRWFVEFSRVFLDSVESEQSAAAPREHPAEIESAFACVQASGAERDRLEDYIRAKCGELQQTWRPFIDPIVEPAAALRKAAEAAPESGANWRSLGYALAQTKEYAAEAEAAYRKSIARDPKNATSWSLLGRLVAKTPGRISEAEAAYRKALELDPQYAGAWNGLGNLLATIPERTAEAEAAYRKVIELRPESAGSWSTLGNLLANVPERIAEAAAAYRKALELDPNAPAGWMLLGYLLAKTPERIVEAEAAYRKALEADPKSAGAWTMLGRLLASMPERIAEAETAYRKAIELDPKLAGPWFNLGSLLADNPERVAEAEAAYREACELEPKNPRFWKKLGFFLAATAGKPKQAEAAFRKSLELEPDNAESIRNLAVLLHCELNRSAESAALLSRAHQLRPEDPISTAILASVLRSASAARAPFSFSIEAAREDAFWGTLLVLCRNYAPFGRILLGICDLVRERDNANPHVRLYGAVALAQLGDFPRASVALEDALVGDPIALLSIGQKALETFFAAAIRSGRVRDCLEAIDKRNWRDAWRPIYEALRAVEAGSAGYLKRVAVEIRHPALVLFRRIAPR